MKRSIIDRIFPPPSSSLQLQYEHSELLARPSSRSPVSPPRIQMHESIPPSAIRIPSKELPIHPQSNASSSPSTKNVDLQLAPLSASVLHHDDPFLPIERAAKALQDTIQSLLDVQSRALNGRMHGDEQDSVASLGSLTPTQSVITPRSSSRVRTVPIRQPVKQKIGLRGARKGIARKMHEIAELKQEELWILETQSKGRENALERVIELETKRVSCEAQIESIREGNTTNTISTLRAEAQGVMSEIDELEHKLLELRVRHRHLSNQADQLESSLESNISSFQGTIALVDKETRSFLKRPPVPHALADGQGTHGLGMYALKPERRTLEMAKDQWTSEREILRQRKTDIENERTALLEGERIWSEAIQRIHHFEQNLREQTAALTNDGVESSDSSMNVVLVELEQVIESLESDLAVAESKNWNLLICVIGAELEAFHQAHEMLSQTQVLANDPSSTSSPSGLPLSSSQAIRDTGHYYSKHPNGSTGSNQSLNDTLKEFSSDPAGMGLRGANTVSKYESEDDEPPSDFLLSR